ncbi:Mitochondrial acidic protein mam33 [Cladophialophora chaetospira]|uniref:Mitochondrial acidic protein mam33 n=1 Tax=Cladophialophora chaetospira TaxID=386627 RepID=A0AA39CD37_9EURO|nr:Mitochondrial acidic protein mam33 [Cladophialophora chaetospira]
MLVLRMFSRALPKAVPRQPAIRSLSSLSNFAPRRPQLRSTLKSSYPAFSTSIARREPAGQSDEALIAKLNNERSLELQSQSDDKQVSIAEYLENSPFQLHDKAGSHEIVLTRDFGNEKIKIKLSVSDISEYPAEDEFDALDEDGALADEDFSGGKRTANQSGAKGGKIDVVSEERIAPADREGEEPEEPEEEPASPAYPAQLTITITKPGSKALEIRAVAQDNTIEIENVSFFPRESLLDAQSTKDASEARSLYAGPPVDELDPELQQMLQQYLEERGIDEELAGFLPEYMDFKEQKEYVKWLEDLENFVKE